MFPFETLTLSEMMSRTESKAVRMLVMRKFLIRCIIGTLIMIQHWRNVQVRNIVMKVAVADACQQF